VSTPTNRGGWTSWPPLALMLSLARRKALQRAVGAAILLVSFAALAAMIHQHWDELRSASWRFEPFRFVVAVLLQASTVAIATWLWADMSYQLGSDRDLRRDARVYAYSLLAKRLPGAFWHVVGRAAYYSDAGLGKRVGVLGSLIEAGLLVLTGVAMALLSIAPLRPYGPLIGVALMVVCPLLIKPVFGLLFRQQRAWIPPLSRLYLWTVVDAVAWGVGSTGVYLLFDAFYPLQPSALLSVTAAVTSSIVASSAVVIVPGGFGLREIGLTEMLSRGEVMPIGVAAPLAIAFRVTIATIEVAWAALVIALIRPRPSEAAEAADAA
jgi:hypothetical protein